MPSTRNPQDAVQPGPGRLPANTVPASALLTDSSQGNAALEGHIVDPSSAHAASAISTLALAGESWDLVASDVQAALKTAYDGLNARAIWVLDAAANADADFSGAGALNAAVIAFATSARKPMLYLRPGTYGWTHPGNTALDRVQILGASTGIATINASSSLVLGAGTVIENVAVTATTAVQLFGASATVRRCTINTGTFTNSGADNTLEAVKLTATGAITQSGNGSSFTGGQWTGASIAVTGNNNTWLGVPFTGTQSLGGTGNIYLRNGAATLTGLSVSGNTTTGSLTSTTTSAGTLTAGSTTTGNLQVNGTLGVTQLSTLQDATTRNLTVTGTLTANISGGSVTGDITATSLTVNGPSTLNGVLNVRDDVVVGTDGGNLQVNGTLGTTGKATIGTDADGADLDVNGNITVKASTVPGTGSLFIKNNLYVDNDATIGFDNGGNLQVNGTIGCTGPATIGTDADGASLDVKGTISSTQPNAQFATFAVQRHAREQLPTNRWKLHLQFSLSNGGLVRFYSGDGTASGSVGSCWCITLNAKWETSVGSWTKDSNTAESNTLCALYGRLIWAGKPPGSMGDYWPDSGWENLGDFQVGSGISAGGEYTYTQSKTRTVTLSPSSGYGDGSFYPLSSGGVFELTAGSGHTWPIVVPHGATMRGVSIKVNNATAVNANITISLHRRHSINFSNTTVPTYQQIASDSFTVTTSPRVANSTILSFGGIQASSLEDYTVFMLVSGSTLQVLAIQFTYEESVLTSHGSR